MVLPDIQWPHKPLLLGLLVVALLLPAPARAQAEVKGDGIKADYYDGPAFERFVVSRRDASIHFDWAHRPPVSGLPAEYFSVRWTGWLVPPASGRYVFHVTVDDGMRIWLNDKLILDEWRPQPVRRFVTSVELKAGEPYRLRVEYFQDILDTRAQLTWERPDVPLTPPPSSWRNLWGRTAETPQPEPIPMRFLFSRNPRPAAVLKTPPPGPRPAVVATAPERPAHTKATPLPLPLPRPAAAPRKQPALTPIARATPVVPTAPAAVLPGISLSDSGSAARLNRLLAGEAVTLSELYFEQGKARLLPATHTTLDGLAAALRTNPALRFEVQGHTDNVGNAELNRQLSQQRAEVVCLYLSAHGASAGQLRPVGYGGAQPVANNADPAQRPRNRRVVLRRQ